MNKTSIIITSLIVTSAVVASAGIGAFVFQSVDSKIERHTVTFDTDGGSEIEPVVVKHGNKITKPKDPTKLGCNLENWLNGNNAWNFSTDTVTKDITLLADWNLITYQIHYDFNGGSTTIVGYPLEYNIESSFDLFRPEKSLNVFGGWFNQDNKRVDSIVPGMTGDLYLTARWLDSLVLTSLDETKGTIIAHLSDTNENEITVTNVPVDNQYHTFMGWYDSNNNLLSTEQTYTFTLIPNQTNYIYSKYMNEAELNIWNEAHAVNPILCDDNNYVLYGMYPQKHLEDGELIAKLNTLIPTTYNNYYYYNHEYYSKKTAYRAGFEDHEVEHYEFDNGENIIEGNDYWFKVEPIKWRIMQKQDDNSAFVISSTPLEITRFNITNEIRIIDGEEIFANDYSHSHLRDWLNTDFLSTAFTFNTASILTTHVDNSASTTGYPEQLPGFEDTDDKLLVLSYRDFMNLDYGFNSNKDRQIVCNDYTRVRGLLYEDHYIGDSFTLYSSYLWTRSSYIDDSASDNKGANVCKITRSGGLNQSAAGSSSFSHLPAMTIKI